MPPVNLRRARSSGAWGAARLTRTAPNLAQRRRREAFRPPAAIVRGGRGLAHADEELGAALAKARCAADAAKPPESCPRWSSQQTPSSAATKDGLGGLERELHATFQASRLPAPEAGARAVAQISNACEDHSPEGVAFVMNPWWCWGRLALVSRRRGGLAAKRRAAEKRLIRQHPSLTPNFNSSTSSGARAKVCGGELLNRLVSELVRALICPSPATGRRRWPGNYPVVEKAGAKGDVLLS